MKTRKKGIPFLIGSLYYLFAETICIIAFNDSPVNTYLYHTISELGIPSTNSPLFYLMNTAFILIGITLIIGNLTEFREYITRNRILFYIFTLVTSTGVILVGLIHGGNPLTSGYHTLGAVMSILGGNLLLVIISISMQDHETYQKITLLLGVIGIIAFILLTFNMENIYMPVYERLSVYTLIIWNLMTGIYLLKE